MEHFSKKPFFHSRFQDFSWIFPKSKELQCILINNRNAQVTSQLYWRMKKNCFRAWSVTKTHIICKKFHVSFCIIWQLKGETLIVNVLGMILSMIQSMTLCLLKRLLSLCILVRKLGKSLFFFFWRVFFSGKTFFQLGYQFRYHQMNYWRSTCSSCVFLKSDQIFLLNELAYTTYV